MLEMLRQHKVMVGVGVVFAIVAIWYGLPSSDSTATIKSTNTATSVVDPTLVQTFLTVSAIDLSGTIFSETAFTSLQDYSTTIVQEPVGRQNPFAPLASGASAPVSSTTSAAAHLFKSSQTGGTGAAVVQQDAGDDARPAPKNPSKKMVVPKTSAE